MKDRNARDKFKIVTFDAEQMAIQQMSEGMIDAMVVQNPFGMGYDSVRYCFAKLTGDEKTMKEMFPKMGEPGGEIYDTGLKVVVPDSGSPLKAEMFSSFGSGVEFLSFLSFKNGCVSTTSLARKSIESKLVVFRASLLKPHL